MYVFDVPASISQPAGVLAILTRTRKRDGTWAMPKPLTVTSQDIEGLPVENDREVLSLGLSLEKALGPIPAPKV